jgi:hypothetical protein
MRIRGKGQRRFLAADDVPTDLWRARPLLQVFNLDNLNLQGDPGATVSPLCAGINHQSPVGQDYVPRTWSPSVNSAPS